MNWSNLAESWPIIGGFLGGAVVWGKTTADVARSKKDIGELQEAFKVVAPMKEAIARVEVHQEYIVAGIKELRERG